MKNFLTKYFGYLGLVIYGILSLIIRIPVLIFLAIFIIVYLLMLGPLTGHDTTPRWIDRLYDWYCGK